MRAEWSGGDGHGCHKPLWPPSLAWKIETSQAGPTLCKGLIPACTKKHGYDDDDENSENCLMKIVPFYMSITRQM